MRSGRFDRFRKPLVRREKLDCSFIALHRLVAAIIALRKVPLTVNIIHGWIPDRAGYFNVHVTS